MTQNLQPDLQNQIANAMQVKNFKIGENIITYGDDGKEYYVLQKGKVKVTVYKPKTDKNDLNLEDHVMFTKELGQGVGFGELALIYNDKRSATITAIEDCETFMLDGVLFK